MQSKLPSWRVGVLVVVVLVIAVGATFLNKKEKSSLEGLTVAGTERSEIDTDGDGLADWEEDLWITDTHNADTDGDGMSDGEEVANNRHPRIPGPDDLIDDGYKEALYALEGRVPTGKTVSAYQNLIEDRIYPALLVAAAQKREGKELSDDELAAILDPLAEEGEKTISFYTKANLVIDPSVSDEAYFSNLVRVLAPLAEKEMNSKPPLEIIANRLENPRSSSSLSSLSSLYTELVKKLITIKVSPDQADRHLELVNAYGTIHASLQSIEASNYNPTVVLVETQRYDTAATRLSEIFYEIGSRISL